MAREKRPRKVFVVLGVPELSFIPDWDREGTSVSPEGTLTNKIFKYRSDSAGSILYANLIDRYGIDALVMGKAEHESRARDYRSGSAGTSRESGKPKQGGLF